MKKIIVGGFIICAMLFNSVGVIAAPDVPLEDIVSGKTSSSSSKKTTISSADLIKNANAYDAYTAAMAKTLSCKNKESNISKNTSLKLTGEEINGSYNLTTTVKVKQRDASRAWATIKTSDSLKKTTENSVFYRYGYLYQSQGLTKIKEKSSVAYNLIHPDTPLADVGEKIIDEYFNWPEICTFDSDAILSSSVNGSNYTFTLDIKKVQFKDEIPFELANIDSGTIKITAGIDQKGYITSNNYELDVTVQPQYYTASDYSSSGKVTSINYRESYTVKIANVGKVKIKYPDSFNNYKEVTDVDILSMLKI